MSLNNISFSGKIALHKPSDAEQKALKYPINYLKYHCGGNNVEHNIFYNKEKNYLIDSINFRYKRSEEKIYGFSTLKKIDLTQSKEKITKELKTLNEWLKRRKLDIKTMI